MDALIWCRTRLWVGCWESVRLFVLMPSISSFFWWKALRRRPAPRPERQMYAYRLLARWWASSKNARRTFSHLSWIRILTFLCRVLRVLSETCLELCSASHHCNQTHSLICSPALVPLCRYSLLGFYSIWQPLAHSGSTSKLSRLKTSKGLFRTYWGAKYGCFVGVMSMMTTYEFRKIRFVLLPTGLTYEIRHHVDISFVGAAEGLHYFLLFFAELCLVNQRCTVR